jgi:hypothetical protein
MLDLSVIICTHNPRPEYLQRVLKALRNQTLPKDRWELLIIDNASKTRLASSWDISWHPNARHVFEGELGLSPARRRGMREAIADLLVFVDDDNVLEESYLSVTLTISRNWPVLGVWGSGNTSLEFEVAPPDQLQKFMPYLALRATKAPCWSNVPSCIEATPWGAGLCVRASVANAYRRMCEESLVEIKGREGLILSAGEDDEISLVSCAHGLGMGVFPDLKLTHLIPKERVSEAYLAKLIEGATTAVLLLDYKWNAVPPRSLFTARSVLSILRSIAMDRRMDRRAHFARMRALVNARRAVKRLTSGSPAPRDQNRARVAGSP